MNKRYMKENFRDYPVYLKPFQLIPVIAHFLVVYS